MLPTNWNPVDLWDRTQSRSNPVARFAVSTAQMVPHTTMKQTETEVILRAEVPGISPEDLDVTVDERSITIRGIRRDRPPEDATFEWILNMPPFVNMDRAAASYHQGVLEVRVPKFLGRRGRRLGIEVK